MTPITKIAASVDNLNLALTAVCALVVMLVVGAAIFFSVKYHASKKVERSIDVQSTKLEIIWTTVTLIVFLGFFYWGSGVYKEQVAPLKPDYEIYVFAKRWMWKFHHPTGFVEINHLHLPAHKNIRLTMISEDVIHSFYIPNIRLKQDILPDVLTNVNFHSEKEGEFPLHCAEYCGTYHSRMGGKTTFLSENAYRDLVGLSVSGLTLAGKGKKLFEEHGCINCHSDQTIAPNLAKKKMDDQFIRESILYPTKYVEKGYDPVMPSFKDSISEEDIRALTQYIKELKR